MAGSQYTGSSPYIDTMQMQAGVGGGPTGGHKGNQNAYSYADAHNQVGHSYADAQKQADALRNPAPQTVSTPVNPLQQTAFDAANKYQSGLANNQNELINKQLATARDSISSGMRSEGIAAMGRGADPSLFRQRALAQGQQYLGHLQTGLTADALAAQGQAVNSLTGAAGSAAGNQTNLQLGTLAAQAEQQRIANEQAAMQARLYQAPYDRLAGMMGQVAQDAPAYAALGGVSPGSGYTSAPSRNESSPRPSWG